MTPRRRRVSALRATSIALALAGSCAANSVAGPTIWPTAPTPIRVKVGTPTANAAAEPGELIDLEAALRLAGVDNPTIGLAREQIQEAFAAQRGANALLLPNVNLGGNFRLHRGALQDDPGFLRRPRSQSLFLGAGAGVVGASGIPIPGVWIFSPLGNAIYEPLVARRRVDVRQAEAAAVRNSTLLDVTTGYLDLVGAEARLEVLLRAREEIQEIVRVTWAFAKGGEALPADANRAAANAALIDRQRHAAEGDVLAASARLCRLVNLDPGTRLRTPGGPVESIQLIDDGTDLEALVSQALRLRPEIAARAAAIQVAQTQVRQERARPLLPTISLGLTAGGMQGGSNEVATQFGPLRGRYDVTAMAFWTVENLGAGNLARIHRANAVAGQASAAHETTINQVRREVGEALSAAQAASRQATAARQALTLADEGHRLDSERVRQGQGRPIEALDSYRQLLDARLDLLTAIIAFDTAQFRLFVALGSPPPARAVTPTPGPAAH